MASGEKMNPDSDDEVDLEALRLAALQTLHAKPKFTPHVNHSNLIPIVPVNVVAPIILHPTIKLEPISPTLEENIQVNSRLNSPSKDDEDRDTLATESDQENDEDILSMDDKEEEDSLERLMDQLEAEISGKAPIPSNRTVIAPKKALNNLKGSHKKSKKNNKREVEVELVEVKIGKQQGPVINIRESVSPEPAEKSSVIRNSPVRSKSPKRSSRTPRKSRSRSPFRRSRSFKRSASPYWSKSSLRSRSPRRSRSPFWMSRRSKSPLRKSRSPYRRSKSPLMRRRSPFRYCSRTRSRSFDRRSRSPWSYSPRKRSRSPHFRDSFSPFQRRRNLISPENKLRKRSSLSPRGKSRSPRHRSRSPRRFISGRRNSPFHRSKSPIRRSRSPMRNKSPFRRLKSPYRRSTSPFSRRTKSPLGTLDTQKRRSPGKSLRRSKSLNRRSLSPGRRLKSPLQSKSPVRGGSKSPGKRNDVLRSPRRSLSKSKRSRSFSISPRRRNRSPLQPVEKNKIEESEKLDNVERGRADKRPRSLSKERRNDYRRPDRRPYRSRGGRRFSPSRGRRSPERQKKRSRSPKKKIGEEKTKETDAAKNQVEDKGTSPVPAVPVDPVLEARKKKFENLGEVDPTVDKKISLKSIKESTDNTQPDDDDDALNINLESDLWDESEESENEHESRFKSGETRIKTNRTVLSFRSLRDDDAKKINLNKPLIEDNRRENYNSNRFDRWQRGRRNDRTDRNHRRRYRDDDVTKSKGDVTNSRDRKFEPYKNKSQDRDLHVNKKSGRKVIMFSSPKTGNNPKDNEVSTTSNIVNSGDAQKKDASDSGFDRLNATKDKSDKTKSDVRETDDFYKLISDFEKELENDICLTSKESEQPVTSDQNDSKRMRISVKKDLFEPRPESLPRKPLPSSPRSSEISSHKDKGNRFDDFRRVPDDEEEGELKEPNEKSNQPDDYVEDDDFVLDEGTRKRGKNREEEDGQNDLRDILSRRRNERLTKAVSLHENMPSRLVQSAFQGLGNKKFRRTAKDSQGAAEMPSVDRNIKVAGTERRRVLLLQRKKPDVPSFKITVPKVKPDTTIHQRLARTDERKRSRKLKKHADSMDEVDQEEDENFEAEEKQPRRIRLKRNVTLSSQDYIS